MIKRIIGIAFIVFSMAGLVFWEVYGREAFVYTEILTVNRDIEENTIITNKMLARLSVNTANENAYAISDYKKVVGKEATRFIPKGTQIFDSDFEDEKLCVDAKKGEYVLSIPNEWLESYPQSLRRGDRVYFYAMGKPVTSAIVVFVKDSSNTEVKNSQEDRLDGSSTVSLVEIIATDKQAQTLSSYAEANEKFVLLYN
ncbi:MAG: hypothetical protein GX663_09905 [Clostridiales bacterium]|nr:hypothetical protein [Clostridiales bacterium]